MPTRKPSFITRNLASKCVLARIRRSHQSPEQYFYLSDYGSWEAAEKAARNWVKDILPTLPDPVPIKDRKTKRNTSGVVGVRLANATRIKNGYVYPDWRWVAFWTNCPQSGGVGWSVNKYGDERAFVCAYIARKSESIDREKVENEFHRLKGTKEFRGTLKLKRLSPP